MNNLTKYYQDYNEVLLLCPYENIIKDNLKEVIKDYIFSELLNYLKDLTKNLPIELLVNINYHSLIWEYLRANGMGMTNALYQELKQKLFKDVPLCETSKLNALNHFNDLMYITLTIYNK